MGKKYKNYNRDMDPSKKQESFEGTQEDLDEYIRVSRPSVVVVIISLLLVLVAVLVWGFIGKIPVNETVTGIVIDNTLYEQLYPEEVERLKKVQDFEIGNIMVYCFLDASRYNGNALKEFGDEAVLKMPDQKTFRGKIESHFLTPVSREEAKKILFDDEWLTEQCVKQNYIWWLTIRPDDDLSKYAQTLSEVTILTDEVAPISFLIN